MPKTKSVKKLPDWGAEQLREFWKTHDSARPRAQEDLIAT
jgi:hypothetical protein